MSKERIIIIILVLAAAVEGGFLIHARKHYGYDVIDDLPEDLEKTSCEFEPLYDDGRVIPVETAIHCADSFVACSFSPDILAYHIGLATIDSMIVKADRHNRSVRNADSSIVGYRFFQGVTTRSFPLDNNDPSKGVFTINGKKDLIAVPVRKNGCDYFKGFPEIVGKKSIDPYEDTPLRIYSHFRPCPRICGVDSKNHKLFNSGSEKCDD